MNVKLITLTLIINVFCTVNLFAQKNETKKITKYPVDLIVYSAFDNTPMSECKIIVSDSILGGTDVYGKITIEVVDEKSKQITINIIPKDTNYTITQFTFNKFKGSYLYPIYIYPNENYEKLIWENEDSIYGTNKSTDPVNIPSFIHIEKIMNGEESEASFQNGYQDLQNYMVNEMIYPNQATMKNIQGKVFLTFIVEKNGNISHIKIEKGISDDLNKEAIRLVRNMPKWTPAKGVNGPLRTNARLPINFTLNGPVKKS